MDHHHHFGYNTKLTPKKNKNCFIVAKKLQHKWVSLFGGKWVGMVASHNNGVLSYHHSLNPQSPPPTTPIFGYCISGIKSNGINFNRSKVQGLSMWGWSSHHVLGFICEVCLASRKTLDYLWTFFFFFFFPIKKFGPCFYCWKSQILDFSFCCCCWFFFVCLGPLPTPRMLGFVGSSYKGERDTHTHLGTMFIWSHKFWRIFPPSVIIRLVGIIFAKIGWRPN